MADGSASRSAALSASGGGRSATTATGTSPSWSGSEPRATKALAQPFSASTSWDCTAHDQTTSVTLSHESATVRGSSTSAPGPATSPIAITPSLPGRGLAVNPGKTEPHRYTN